MKIQALISFLAIASSADALAPSGRRAFLNSAAAAALSTTAAILPANAVDIGGKPVFGKDDLMTQKSHGTSDASVQSDLQYGVSNKLADQISNYNRRFAEQAGYFGYTSFEEEVRNSKGPVTFYDSVTGKPLFVAPIGRSADQFIAESEIHGESHLSWRQCK